MVEALVSAGTLPWYAPWFFIWYGAWAAGATIPLNPLGNQGATLSTVLTAPANARQIIHGYLAAAALPVALVTAALAVAAGVLAGRSEAELVVLALSSIGAVIIGTVWAAGIGSVFPRFDGIDFVRSKQATPPSKAAYGLFSTVLTLTVVAVAIVADELISSIIADVLSGWLPAGVGISSDVVVIACWLILGVAVAAIPISYVVAVRRIAGYRIS